MYNDPKNEREESEIRSYIEGIVQMGPNYYAPGSAEDKIIKTSINSEETPEESKSGKQKELKLAANMYTVCYCAFMKANKKKYNLK